MSPPGSPATVYGTLDGVFQQALPHHLAGHAENVALLRAEPLDVVDLLVTNADQLGRPALG